MMSVSEIAELPPESTDAVGLVVKPDFLTWLFALHAARPVAKDAVAAIRASVEDLTRDLAAVPNAAVRLRGFSSGPAYAARAKESEQRVGASGSIEVPLQGDLDFWGHAAIRASVQDALANCATRWLRSKSPVTSRFGSARSRVREPEKHLSALTELLFSRARHVAAAARSGRHSLVLRDLRIPGPVMQEQLSFDEVRLTISVGGRIDSPISDALNEPDPSR